MNEAMKKERPILFSAPMVRALLAGTKTQTRRIVKQRKDRQLGCYLAPCELAGEVNAGKFDNCPYGHPGDRLWVRESFQPLLADGVEYADSNWETGAGYQINYPASGGAVEYIDMDDNIKSGSKPSIHMPRWACRILLEIVSVRIEKLQTTSEADAEAEGVDFLRHVPDADETLTAAQLYACLWDSINGDGSWDTNPWVWVVEFKRIES